MMKMTFYVSNAVQHFMLKNWSSSTLFGILLICFCVSMLVILLEMNRQAMQYLSKRNAFDKLRAVCENQPRLMSTYRNKSICRHIASTFLHMSRVLVAYLIMLAAMTYNVWIMVTIILLCGMCYYFGEARRPKNTPTPCSSVTSNTTTLESSPTLTRELL